MSEPRLELRDLALLHPGGGGLHPTSLVLAAGERLVLLGPTGSGKSTLLRLIAGLDTPQSGDVFIDGRRVTDAAPHQRGIAFVPQRPALYPHVTVAENLRLTGPDIATAAAALKIEHLLDRRPEGLSGGEKQRVALAKAQLRQAAVWLLDEPFAPLDPVFRAEFREELLLLLKSLAATIIFVSHDPNDALALGRLVGVLDAGRLIQLGTPEDLAARPGNRFVEAVTGQFPFRSQSTQ
jgi:multiple sugar transport system ATP-binding protein